MAKSLNPLPASIKAALPSAVLIVNDLQVLMTASLPALVKDIEAAKHNPVELARAMVALHRLHDIVEGFEKKFSAIYEECKTKTVPDVLEATNQKFISLAEGFRVGVAFTWRASIKEGQKDVAYHWLRANKLGDLISSTVNASTLSAAAKHRIEEQNLDFPEDLFNVAHMPNTSVTQT